MNTPAFASSSKFRLIAGTITAIIVILLVFRAGMLVGFHKASFSYRWGDNYHRNFGGPRGGFMVGFSGGDRDFIDANGTFGQIIRSDAGSLVIRGDNEAEKVILLDGKTTIKRQREDIRPSDVKTGEFAVVIGEDDVQGRITARLIRIMPPPPTGSGAMMEGFPMPVPFRIPLR